MASMSHDIRADLANGLQRKSRGVYPEIIKRTRRTLPITSDTGESVRVEMNRDGLTFRTGFRKAWHLPWGFLLRLAQKREEKMASDKARKLDEQWGDLFLWLRNRMDERQILAWVKSQPVKKLPSDKHWTTSAIYACIQRAIERLAKKEGFLDEDGRLSALGEKVLRELREQRKQLREAPP